MCGKILVYREKIDLVVDGSWAETAGDNPDDFLLYDNGPHAQIECSSSPRDSVSKSCHLQKRG
jgi:hypothetical protein